jgi:hypothetical protein
MKQSILFIALAMILMGTAFLMFIFKLNHPYDSESAKKASNRECEWPEEILKADLIELNKIQTIQFIKGLEYDPIMQKHFSSSIMEMNITDDNENELPGPKECSITEQKEEWNIGSLCPFWLKWVVRKDVYPWRRKVARTSCGTCVRLDQHFSCICVPVYILQPALKKGNCQLDGLYERIPKLELVRIAFRPMENVGRT